MNEETELKPSDFSNVGQPCCSIWGKTETEQLAWVYVTTMARAGNEWKPVTAQQCLDLLTEQEHRHMGWELRRVASGEDVPRWNAVAERITDEAGALSVKGFWDKWSVEKVKRELANP